MTTPLSLVGETWGERIEPVREYILAEAEQPFSVLLPKLEAAHARFMAAADGLSDEQGERRPGGGEGEDAWGIAEVLRHIASIEPIMVDRVRALGSGGSVESLKPTYPGYMEAVDTRLLSELRPVMEQSYANLVKAIADIDGHERLDALAPHRLFGEMNCRGWIVMHGIHLDDHTRQMGNIKATLGLS